MSKTTGGTQARSDSGAFEGSGPRTVADLMSPEVVTVSPNASLRAFARLLRRNRISGAPVVDETGRALGMASVSDLVWLCDLIAPEESDPDAAKRRRELDTRTVHEIMTPDVFGVGPEAGLAELARFFVRTGLHRALVLDDGRVVGVVSVVDLLGLAADEG